MTLPVSRNVEKAIVPGLLIRIGRKQNGSSFYTKNSPTDLDRDGFVFDGSLDRGERVLILDECVHTPNWFTTVKCLTSHGIVWATTGGFRFDD